MGEIRKAVGQRIYRFRLKRGLSQESLGDKVNLSQESISEIEKGKRNVRLETIHIIANELGVGLGDLYADFYLSCSDEETISTFYGLSPALHRTLNEVATWPLEDQNELNQMLQPLLRLRESTG